MNKNTIRKGTTWFLLLIIAFLYLYSLYVFIVHGFEAGLAPFAFCVVFTVILYFALLIHKRVTGRDDD